jgi:potassium-transporting ATPase KdpC subunit
MSGHLAHLRPAVVMIAGFTLVTGVAYPLAITGVAQLMPGPAHGSLLRDGAGRVRGSALIGQGFSRPEYLHPRPSAAGNGYDPTSSGGSNYGPMDPKLADRVKGDAASIAKSAPGAAIPADAVTASGSGLDPDISPAYAALQAPRIAAARRAPVDAVRRAIDGATRGPTLGVLGEPRVNVLLVNRELDRALPLAAAAK